jgi:hypothetical protein
LLSEKVCALLRNHCAACSGITVRLTPESLCGIDRILQLPVHLLIYLSNKGKKR